MAREDGDGRSPIMEWDLGPQGIGVLVLLSVGVGLVAQVIAARYTTDGSA